MANQQDTMRLAMAKIIATAWIDVDFKSRLLSNPRATLAEGGLTPPPQLELNIVANSEKLTHISLPAPWADASNPDFMRRLQQHPRAVLLEAGITVLENSEIVFLENTNNRMNIVIPVSPGKDEISIEKI